MKSGRLGLIVVALFLFGTVVQAKMHFSDPKPTFENPRKIIMRIYENDIHKVNHTVAAVNNIFKEYPVDSLKIAVLFYGPGMRVIKKDFDPATLKRIRSLFAYDVEIVGCLNTMETMGWKKNDFINGVDYVQAGVAEAIERKAGGWIDATPY
jgi:intracellular sulfur oxidation DsrE/DsrF family protein